MAKIEKNTLSIRDLIDYQEAVKIVCRKYENMVKRYDNSITFDNDSTNKFNQYNKLYGKIVDEIENRINQLKF